MKCRAIKSMFSEYIDDELASEQKEVVDLHVRDCVACREEFEELLACHQMFASAESYSAPLGFSTRVMANMEEGRRSLWRSLFVRPVFLKAMEVTFALIIVIIGLISGSLLTANKRSDGTWTEVRRSFALDVFEAAPSGSLGNIYASMTGVKDER